ncbi:MAG: CDP-alcohol phosphatidyltransferase family protein [Patescibacteria group bacterium]|nr:CDP-alcohol phosphatidyltransferase family protein [Patescibacteria group bacterium]
MDGFIYSFIKIIPSWVKPNHLSLLRILMIGPIIILLFVRQNIIAMILFILTALLDTFDGVLARVRAQKTKEGEWLDPLADKLLILSILWLYGLKHLPLWLIAITTILESLLVLGRPIKIKFGISTKANSWGKIKMTLQSLALTGLIAGIEAIRPLIILLLFISLCSAFLSLLAHFYDIVNRKQILTGTKQ